MGQWILCILRLVSGNLSKNPKKCGRDCCGVVDGWGVDMRIVDG